MEQHGKSSHGRGAPGGARPPADRLHHQRPGRLHGRGGAARRVPPGAGRSRDRLRPDPSRRAASTPRAAIAPWPRSSAAHCRMPCSWPATWSPWGCWPRSGPPAMLGAWRRIRSCASRATSPRRGVRGPAAHHGPRLQARGSGIAAGMAILERIAGRPVERRSLLPTELIVRASTAPRTGSGVTAMEKRAVAP